MKLVRCFAGVDCAVEELFIVLVAGLIGEGLVTAAVDACPRLGNDNGEEDMSQSCRRSLLVLSNVPTGLGRKEGGMDGKTTTIRWRKQL